MREEQAIAVLLYLLEFGNTEIGISQWGASRAFRYWAGYDGGKDHRGSFNIVLVTLTNETKGTNSRFRVTLEQGILEQYKKQVSENATIK